MKNDIMYFVSLWLSEGTVLVVNMPIFAKSKSGAIAKCKSKIQAPKSSHGTAIEI